MHSNKLFFIYGFQFSNLHFHLKQPHEKTFNSCKCKPEWVEIAQHEFTRMIIIHNVRH